jgi:hypothetical protein
MALAVAKEVRCEAPPRMKDGKSDYLSPPPLTAAQVKSIYGPNEKDKDRERSFGRAAFASVRRAARKDARP